MVSYLAWCHFKCKLYESGTCLFYISFVFELFRLIPCLVYTRLVPLAWSFTEVPLSALCMICLWTVLLLTAVMQDTNHCPDTSSVQTDVEFSIRIKCIEGTDKPRLHFLWKRINRMVRNSSSAPQNYFNPEQFRTHFAVDKKRCFFYERE